MTETKRDAPAAFQTDAWPSSSGPLISRWFGLSLCVHGAFLAMVVITAGHLTVPHLSLYDEEVRPFESKVIWYNLKTKTPDVSPTRAPKTRKAPRAVRKLDQNLIAGLKEDPHPAQKVWVPEPPKVELPKIKSEPLPNLLAVANEPKRPLRKFQAPPAPQPPKPKPAQSVPDAPEVALKLNATALPKDFSLETKIARRAFVPPAPTKALVKTAAAELPPAPESQMQNATVNAATMAIVGLDPSKTMEIPKPPPPRDANFSAGPKLNPKGESTPSSKAGLTVPGLYASGGPKDARAALTAGLNPLSQQNLMATLRPGATPPHAVTGPHAPRVSSSPDPRMDGRAVYMMAIQMQNITSYSGSWMVWFAEHQPLPGAAPAEMRPPDPRRKVDPKYNTDAVQERVEGTVRLSAVIRKDGRVDSVELLKHLDDRLDKDAEEALAKWQFEPALRDGTPIDVDAVFEIPFRLAPRTTTK